jgi:TetR/AcrR family transcriptional regulator, transcriptional repressor for nem operon
MTTDPITGRRLTRKGEATRERIVAAAARLTLQRGVVGTSLDEVKAAADVSSSQLYHYFADKHELIRAVIAYRTDMVLDSQQPLVGQLDSIEALRVWRDHTVGVTRHVNCEGGCPIGALVGELAETDPEARADIAAGFRRWEDEIRRGLRTMHERGDLRADADPDRLALGLLGALEGGLLLTQVRRDPAPLEASLDVMLDHIESLTT